jgi:hypothetical protein
VFWITAASILIHAQSLQNPRMLPTAVDPVGLIAADWNGDGNQDLVYVQTGDSPSLYVLLGNGKGGFTEGAVVPLPVGACSFEALECRLYAGDFNNDGTQDILMAANFPSAWGFVVLPGNGDGTFGAPIVSIVPPSREGGGGATMVPYAAAVADFNGDGNLDIVAPDPMDSSFNLYLGDGAGKFTLDKAIGDFNAPTAVYTADVNHDGHLDLIVFTELIGGAEIWLGVGKGGFTLSQSYPSNAYSLDFRAKAVADLNGDGNVDLVGADASGDVLVATGNPDGTFNSAQLIAQGMEPGNIYLAQVFVADLTGSGTSKIRKPTAVHRHGRICRAGDDSSGFCTENHHIRCAGSGYRR